ncbi:MAG: hypothetical protein D6694_02180 [Gammaproteobacteria bacterium]|nr:MAG: hypothetical protein D6694_02180 [Gammaproteobacteria bacterium]
MLGDANDENRKAIKKWLVQFYEQFADSGIGGMLIGQRGSFYKRDWWQAYSQGNGGRLTCAICDGTMNHAITVEHYLPKSIYPVLALHPHNLIPACDKCNSLKGEKDPLKDGRTFQSVVMPYREAVRDIARLEFSDVDGDIIVNLLPANPDPHTLEKITVLSELFDLPGQWQRNMPEIGQIAYRRVKQHFRTLQTAGVPITPGDIPVHVAKICSFMQEDWGIEHYGYPATEWLTWASGHKLQVLAEDVRSLLENPKPHQSSLELAE